MNTIRPDLLAGKIEEFDMAEVAAKHNVSECALRELLWFLQAVSMLRDGIKNLVGDLLTRYSDRFITKHMSAGGSTENGRYTMEQCLKVWSGECESIDLSLRRFAQDSDLNPESFRDWLLLYMERGLTPAQLEKTAEPTKAAIMRGYKTFNFEFLKRKCDSAARGELERLLVDFCINKSTTFRSPWYCHDLLNLLFEYVNDYAAQRRASIVQTEVTRIVFDELDFSYSKNVPLQFLGESRIGKTSPASTWCDMRPGRARLVTVPQTNRMRDFIEAHAEALGIDHGAGRSTAALTAEVKYVLRHSRLFLAYDESHYLIPVSYCKTTAPARLNFVRATVIDPGDKLSKADPSIRGVCCALFATPQDYQHSLDQYVKTTGHKIEQWLGRLAPIIVLPADMSKLDLLDIASLHFPGIPRPYLKLIVARAMQIESIKSIEFTAKRAEYIAEKNGRKQPIEEDIVAAIAYIMPGVSKPSAQPIMDAVVQQPAVGQPAADKSPRLGRGAAKPLQPSREVTPAGSQPAFPAASTSPECRAGGGIEMQLTA